MDAIEICGLAIAKSNREAVNTTTLAVVFRRKLRLLFTNLSFSAKGNPFELFCSDGIFFCFYCRAEIHKGKIRGFSTRVIPRRAYKTNRQEIAAFFQA